MTRYAIYFAPPDASPLWRFGSRIIGYDAATGKDEPLTETAGRTGDDWATLTAEPRRYGFHATLKAPFEPACGINEDDVLRDVEAEASRLSPITLPALHVAAIGRFIALVPIERSEELQTLAAAVVERLDHLRRPLSEADRARRLASPLTPRQLDYLDRFGYPYVGEEFRFHMTLTGPIAEDSERERIRLRLGAAFRDTVPAAPVSINTLAVFCQPKRDDRFQIMARFPLGGPRALSTRQ